MTTIAVVRKNGAVALAADTLSKDGSTMLRSSMAFNHSKVLRVGDSLLASTGTGTWEHVLRHYFASLKRVPDFSGVDAIFDTVSRMHSTLKRRYALNPRNGDYDAFESSRFHLLIANPHGAFVVFPDRAVTDVATFYALGSGYRFALGAMHAAYSLVDGPEEIARVGVGAAAELDEDTGLPLEVHSISLAARSVDA